MMRRPALRLRAAGSLLGLLLAAAAAAQEPTATATVAATATPTRTPTVATGTVGGSYDGTWASASGAGALSLTLAQDGDSLTGTAVFRDHPCLGLARFTGRVSGNAVNGIVEGLTAAVTGNVRLTTNPAGMAGTYSLVAGCAASANGTLAVVGSATGTVRGTPTPTATGGPVTATPTATPTATQPPAPVGDCNRDGEVTVEELVAMSSIALGTRPLPRCTAADANGDAMVTVDEILRAVSIALGGVPGTEPPPPLVERCLALGIDDCVCRGEVCCIAGSCAAGEPCRRTTDCAIGLRCAAGDGGAVCGDGGTVVPPPR